MRRVDGDVGSGEIGGVGSSGLGSGGVMGWGSKIYTFGAKRRADVGAGGW